LLGNAKEAVVNLDWKNSKEILNHLT